jgi:Fe-S-cluster containining protein
MDDFDRRLMTCTREELEAVWPTLAADVLRQVDSPAPADDFAAETKDDPEVGPVLAAWDDLDQASRGPAFAGLTRALVRAAYATRPYCLGCGRCCRRSGPALFLEDRGLIESGRIAPGQLLTLRPGESGFSPALDRVVALDREVVTIRSRPEGGCPFFDPAIGCRIYGHRPRQCRQLECWRPESMDELAGLPPLGRGDLALEKLPTELIRRQAAAADFTAFAAAVRAFSAGDASAAGRAVSMMEADLALRRDAEQQGLDPAGLQFWFGRPLVMVLPTLGWRLVRDDTAEWTLAPAGPERDPLPTDQPRSVR